MLLSVYINTLLSRDAKNSATCQPIDPQLTILVAEFDIIDFYMQVCSNTNTLELDHQEM